MRIGLVTIGQSPRDDIMAVLQHHLPSDCEPIEAGALDDASPRELRAMAPGPGERVLVSRMRDGSEVRVGKNRITARLVRVMRSLDERGCQVIVLLCTDRFPRLFVPFSLRALVVEPEKLLLGSVGSFARGRTLGIIVPSAEQIEETREIWQGVCRAVQVVTASPYASIDGLERAAHELAGGQDLGSVAGLSGARVSEVLPDIVVMDCMGFNLEHKRLVIEILRRPAVLAADVVGKMLSELAH